MSIAPLTFFTGNNAPEAKPISYIVQDFLARGAPTILFGQPGVSKTAHTAHLVACLCLGKPFATMPVCGKCRVLYLDLDAGWSWAGPLFRAAFGGVGLEGLPESFAYWSPMDSEAQEGDVIDNSLEGLSPRVVESAKKHDADLVVIDSLGQFLAGDSNSAQDMSMALRNLTPLRALGIAVLVIDHATKAARTSAGTVVPTPAGSQQKRAWARITVALEEEEYQGERATRWSVDKSNTKHFHPFLTRLDFQNDSSGQLSSLTLERIGEAGPRDAQPDASAHQIAQRSILDRLKQGVARWGELLQLEGVSGRSALSRALKDLENLSLIKKDEAAKAYSLTQEFQGSSPLSVGTLELETQEAVPSGFQELIPLEPRKKNDVLNDSFGVPRKGSKAVPILEVSDEAADFSF